MNKNSLITISLITILVIVDLLLSYKVFALTISPTSYVLNSDVPIIASCDSGGTAFRYFADDCGEGCLGATDCSFIDSSLQVDLNEGSGDIFGELTPPFELTILEFIEDGNVCDMGTYEECINSGDALDQVILNIDSPPTPTPPTRSGGGTANFPPVIELTTEISGVYSKELSIYYSAADPNFGDRGLKDMPITILYSDDRGVSWKELATEQSNTGDYTFDTTKVPDGKNYKIRVVARDYYEYFGEADSEIFSIDNTGPIFDISISPLPVREKDTIVLDIISSEELKMLPRLQIIQKGAESKMIAVSGSKREFSASYYVERGSGKAVISILGEDLVNNVGKTIASGGSFLVGVYGPPPPVISSPINNQIFTQPFISVIGSSQPDTDIILTLNGITKLATRSLADGSFEIDNVPLTLTVANYGNNTFSIIAINEKEEESEEAVLKVKLNSPPEILSISIVAEEILSGQKEITWASSDLNDDKLVFSIEYSNDGGISWDYIISDLSEASYKLDTTQLADGSNYLIRVIVDDGIKKVSKISKGFTIKNNLPHISLDIPLNYFININTPTLTGKITSPVQKITLAEYSLDGGTTWRSAVASDGSFNSLIEKIKIPISESLKDGKYTILVRARDVLNRLVKTSRAFTVDTVPPVLEFLLLDKILDNSTDTNLELDGLQIIFSGKTEPKANIKLILEDEIYGTIADEKGEFKVKNVTLPIHGPNKISLTSSDLAKNITKISGVVILNNPPQISILNPKEEEFLRRVEEISWEVRDIDNDPIVSRILYRKKGKEWTTIIKDLASQEAALPNVYGWDISKIVNGNYQIKIVISDGMSETEAILNIFIDNIAPKATLDISGPLLTNNAQPSFSGRASDDFSGIQYVEYSFDNVNWYKTLITKGYQTLEANFKFQHRFPLADGNYQLRIRASDLVGNVAYSTPLDLTIDTTPPRIGSNLISSGALILFPDETGIIKLFKNTPYRISVSVDGDAKEVTLKTKETTFDFNLNKATFLWESEFNFKDPGDYSLVISVRDEMGNFQTKEIVVLSVVPFGSIYNKETNERIKEAKITLYFFDQNTNSWLIWDAQAFGQKNPQETDTTGEYGFLVPPGIYRLEVSHRHFKTVGSEELEIKKNYLININIPLTEKKGIFNKILDYFIQFYEKI